MATLSERLQFLISVNSDEAVRGFNQIGRAADRDLGKVEKSFDKTIASTKRVSAGLLAFAGIGAAALTSMANKAGDLAEAQNKANEVFGEGVDEVSAFAETAAEKLGLSERAALDAASTFGQYADAAGLAGEESVDFSTDLVTLATDLGSFNNVPTADVVRDIQAAFSGSTETLRKYGVFLDDATLKAKALELGVYDGVGALDAQAKIIASNALLFEGTTKAQGDFARTSDGLANSQKILAAEMENLQAQIGEAFVPVLQTAIGFATSAIDVFSALNDATGGLAGQFATFSVVAAGGVGALGLIGAKAVEAIAGLRKMGEAVSKLGVATSTAFIGLGAATAGLTVGLLVLDKINRSKREAEERTRSLAEALALEDDARREAVAGLVLEDESLDRVIEGQRRLGLSIEDTAQFAKEGSGEAAAFAEMWAKIDDEISGVFPKLEALREQLGLPVGTSADELAIIRDYLIELGKVRSEEEKVASTRRKVQLATEGYLESVFEAADAGSFGIAVNQELAESEEEVADAAEEAEEALKRLNDALDRSEGIVKGVADVFEASRFEVGSFASAVEAGLGDLSARLGAQEVAASFRDIGAAMEEVEAGALATGTAFSTASGDLVELDGAFVSLGESVRGQLDAMIANGGSLEDARFAAARYREEVIELAREHGLSEAVANDYIDTIGLADTDIITAFKQVGMEEAQREVEALLTLMELAKLPVESRINVQTIIAAGAGPDEVKAAILDEFARFEPEILVRLTGLSPSDPQYGNALADLGSLLGAGQRYADQNPIEVPVIARRLNFGPGGTSVVPEFGAGRAVHPPGVGPASATPAPAARGLGVAPMATTTSTATTSSSVSRHRIPRGSVVSILNIVQNLPPGTDPRQIIAALRRAERRNGAVVESLVVGPTKLSSGAAS